MKKLFLSAALVSALILTSCKDKTIDTANCKSHERNCPLSEDCPEHPECEAHEKCAAEKDCKEHPACEAYEKSKA